MQTLPLAEILAATRGSLVAQGSADILPRVVTDNRAITPGCIFVALRGERFDGNNFAADASQRGAAAVIISREQGEYAPACSVVQVEDTLAALQNLARWWRIQLRSLHVVGLTGSSGKTSTKDMVRGVLAQRYRTAATQGNLNNHIGVPLSILATPQDTEAAVWEMGMNHMGELAPLCELTQPQIGIITNIGSAHVGNLGSRDNIAQEKCTLARCLPADGFMIYPAGDDYATMIASQTRALAIPVGEEGCDVRALNVRHGVCGTNYTLCISGLGEVEVTLPVPGAHMVSNSLLAAAAGWKLGCTLEEIAAGLSASTLTHGRLSCREIDGYVVVDDSYNANPESMLAALKTVAALPGKARRVAVLGLMGELGAESLRAHELVGLAVAELKYDVLLVVGRDCEELKCLICSAFDTVPVTLSAETPDDAAEALRCYARPGDIILFKGSRSAGMERVIAAFLPNA